MTELAVWAGDLSPTLQMRKAQPGKMESHARRRHGAISVQVQGFRLLVCDHGHISSLFGASVSLLILSLKVVARIK